MAVPLTLEKLLKIAYLIAFFLDVTSLDDDWKHLSSFSHPILIFLAGII